MATQDDVLAAQGEDLDVVREQGFISESRCEIHSVQPLKFLFHLS